MGLLKIRKLAAFAVISGCCAAASAGGIRGYLAQIGPSPLRFSLATADFSFALPSALVERIAPTNTAEIPSAKTNSVEKAAETNVVAQVPVSAPSANNVPAPSSPAPQTNFVNTASASDLLVVSPQMLTEFFKSGSDGTNSANTTVVLPAPVG